MHLLPLGTFECGSSVLSVTCEVVLRAAPGRVPALQFWTCDTALVTRRKVHNQDLLSPALTGSAAQAAFPSLSDDLIRGIIGSACARRHAQPAAAEVRSAVGLLNVCRRVRNVLRARPLPLELDFSRAPLSARQRSWLAARVRVGYVEGVRICKMDCTFWKGAHRLVLQRHGHTLQRLAGVPLRLVSTTDRSVLGDVSHALCNARLLDLRGLGKLTHLSVLLPLQNDLKGQERLWLVRDLWPDGLVELELLCIGARRQTYTPSVNVLQHLAWAPSSPQRSSGAQPHSTLVQFSDVHCSDFRQNITPLLWQHPLVPALHARWVAQAGACEVGNIFSVFAPERTCNLLVRCNHVCAQSSVEGGAAHGSFPVQSLCGSVSAAEIRSSGRALKFWACGSEVHAHVLLRMLIAQCSRQYALKVVKSTSGPVGWLKVLAWRRWPLQSSSEWQAVADDHAYAVWWANEGRNVYGVKAFAGMHAQASVPDSG
jgi:hypothetical protein